MPSDDETLMRAKCGGSRRFNVIKFPRHKFGRTTANSNEGSALDRDDLSDGNR